MLESKDVDEMSEHFPDENVLVSKEAEIKELMSFKGG
jgi:hypothetical protein